jgi:hypothetical protein
MLQSATAVLTEFEFWLVAAFTFGALYSYLWGRNGMAKGVTLAGVYLLVQAIIALLQLWMQRQGTSALNAVFTVRAWLLLLFLVVLGLRIDSLTLRRYQ